MTQNPDAKKSRRQAVEGAEQYPFDPLLRPEGVDGLDRIRCISDRRYAATLYEIYVLAERNEQDRAQADERKLRVRKRLRELAIRALAGALGAEAEELAWHAVADGDGNVREDDAALAKFGRALAELGAL